MLGIALILSCKTGSLPSLKLTTHAWKWMVKKMIRLPFGIDGLFSWATLVSGRVSPRFTLPETNIAGWKIHHFDGYLPGKMGDVNGQTVSFREGMSIPGASSPVARYRHLLADCFTWSGKRSGLDSALRILRTWPTNKGTTIHSDLSKKKGWIDLCFLVFSCFFQKKDV